MGFVLSYASSVPHRRRASEGAHEGGHPGGHPGGYGAPRRSERLELAFAQIGMALSRRAAARDDATPTEGDEPSVVDRLLGRCCSQR